MKTQNIKSLNTADINERCIIKYIECAEKEKLRLYDLGFVPFSSVVPLYTSFLSGTRAYLVKGSIIALRREYGEAIKITEEGRA